MSEMMRTALVSDPEFTALIQPPVAGSTSLLEENLLDRGCQEPILAWGNIIIDGNKRFEACQRNRIRFEVKAIDFPSRAAALSYLCSEQLKRKDLTNEYYKYLLGKKYLYELSIYYGTPDDESPAQGHAMKYDIAHRVASGRNMSLNTVMKYGEYAQAVDIIRQKSPAFAERILAADIRISHSSAVELSRRPKDEICYLHERLLVNGRNRLQYNEIYEELRLRFQASSPAPKAKKEPAIRQMPKYDPEAEISSLILTVPSWITSMERAHSRTNYSLVSADAKEKIRGHLSTLSRIISKIMRATEEESA